jgi:hypothetical protein
MIVLGKDAEIDQKTISARVESNLLSWPQNSRFEALVRAGIDDKLLCHAL